MKHQPYSAALLLISAAPIFAQSIDSNESCKPYLQTPLPTEARRGTVPKAWPSCNSYKLYSGIGTKVDYAAARRCAWQERLARLAQLDPQNTLESLFGGSAMLTVLYANGEGVEQDKALALRFACEAEMNPRGLNDIEALPSEAHISGKKFRYCAEAFTTFEMNFCAAYDAEIAAQRRQDALVDLSRGWPPEHLAAYKVLEKAAEEYVTAHGAGEVYQGGTIRGIRTNGVEERQRNNFLAAVQEFESGRLPKGTEADFRKADSDLNATYKKALALAAAQKNDDEGDIRPEGIQKAEKAWLKYRDSWVAFAKVHYPNTNSNAWLTLLTTNRVWSLRMTSCEVGWDDPACKRK